MALRNIGNNSEADDIARVANENFRLIDNRFRVNVVRQDTGNAIVQGKLPYEGGYGSLYYDSNGIPNTIVGILPDGTIGIVSAKEGENILDAFS
jgi:hypothetical protein